MARPVADPARQLERAHRILDAAAELILRFGYDKTTVDDVARTAGVAKGTIYLHWKTRDALFAALLRRERVRLLEDVTKSAPATHRDLLESMAGQLLRRPLMKASLLGDSAVLGKLTRRRRESGQAMPMGEHFETYLAVLGEQGVLRADLTATEHLTVLSSTLHGFLIAQQYLPDSVRLRDERLAELVADVGSRAVGSGETGDAQAIARATKEFLDAATQVAQAKLRASLGSKEYPT
ncbi:TetR/AcrR family transcriptional regulator [Nonomuraea dietziae]|uniref:TetR/AcrR family transcriptional regulator n=1 Tax=Nonomuraea dietziae TaxID=65515 RepID=UPI0033ED04C6